MKTQITSARDGTLRFLGALPLHEIGTVKVKRLSHILPVRPVKRLAFRFLRLCFGERGRVAEWTRKWRGPWEGIIIGSNKRFLSPSRRIVIQWELEHFNGPKFEL